MLQAEAPTLWPSDVKSWLTEKDPDAGKNWRQKEKRATEDEMVGWHPLCNGHKLGQTLGDGERQRSLVCCNPWHCRVRHNLRTEQQQQQTYLKNISEIIYINKVIWKINVWNIFNLLGFSGHKQYNINKLWLISIKGNWLENYLELPEWMSTGEGNVWKKQINYRVSGVLGSGNYKIFWVWTHWFKANHHTCNIFCQIS